jgi:cytochrome c oxidase cbb3-type subunit 3
MTSRCLASLALLLALAACDRESRDPRGTPLPENSAARVRLGDLHAGGQEGQPPDPRAAQYEGVAAQVSQGQQLYMRMNCYGCHFHGGGGIGPALMDDEWRYGSSMAQIVSTIDEGRPNGMPSFRNKMTEQQMWQVAAYVRTLSGQVAKDVVSARADEMSSTPPHTHAPQVTPRNSDVASTLP